MISQFSGQYAFLSNFHNWDLNLHGWHFPTAEHAFQATKTLDPASRKQIQECLTPGMAKRMGRRINLRSDWEDIKTRVMLEVVLAKFNTPERMSKLLATGSEKLVEGNYWHDQFWGNCLCDQHLHIEGMNYLGKVLMYVRKHEASRFTK